MAATQEIVQELIRAGRINVGMTRQALFLALGEPDEFGGTSNKYKHPSIYKYGQVQFVFPPCQNQNESQHGGLQYIYIDDDQSDGPTFLLR